MARKRKKQRLVLWEKCVCGRCYAVDVGKGQIMLIRKRHARHFKDRQVWGEYRKSARGWRALIKRHGRRELISRLIMHRHLKKSDGTVDHLNGDTLDNRRENLRVVSKRVQSLNRRMHSNNTSGEKGVIFIESIDSFRAHWGKGPGTTATFSCKKFGKERAFELAVAARTAATSVGEYAEALAGRLHPETLRLCM